MKNATAIFIAFLFPFLLHSQEGFKIIAPDQPVVFGESFQVQYVFPAVSMNMDFKKLSFKGFRVVRGPEQFPGKDNNVKGGVTTNFVYTLEAEIPGRFKLPVAIVTIDGKSYRSKEDFVEVITQQQAIALPDKNSFGNSDYTLRPGEDPYQKIRQNLFLKVMVDRKTCFAGEPVLATFKLYSRLQSRSDIVKNPGFYGFTVYDMVNLSDKEMVTEVINGKIFDVHTIRKVQLFPLQEGVYTIDAMEVTNKVEFSRSSVNKRTEQEITEGVSADDENETTNKDTETFETKINTEPVTINVKALVNKPPSFDGAVGSFDISSSLVKNKIAKNEEGVFEIVIKGQGNFTQINAPVIAWPKGIEGFEPTVKDEIDKMQFPLKGSRTFRYSFTCISPGQYKLPAVRFTYFDPRGNYKTDSSAPLTIEVGAEIKKEIPDEEKKTSITATNASASKIAVIIVVAIFLAIMIYWIRYKKEPEDEKVEKAQLPTVEELFVPAHAVINNDDREFYSTLHRCTWNFFIIHFYLSGSDMNKDKLIATMKTAGTNTVNIDAIDTVLRKCEAGMFTQADIAENKEALLQHTEEVLKNIYSDLFKPA